MERVKAVFGSGVFHPLVPVPWLEGTRVFVEIDTDESSAEAEVAWLVSLDENPAKPNPQAGSDES
jgi:predicted DNA-binding antitoxin AbrB/MazE fold protein